MFWISLVIGAIAFIVSNTTYKKLWTANLSMWSDLTFGQMGLTYQNALYIHDYWSKGFGNWDNLWKIKGCESFLKSNFRHKGIISPWLSIRVDRNVKKLTGNHRLHIFVDVGLDMCCLQSQTTSTHLGVLVYHLEEFSMFCTEFVPSRSMLHWDILSGYFCLILRSEFLLYTHSNKTNNCKHKLNFFCKQTVNLFLL